ncbi:MAG TPA: FAD-binding oxidoreductase [Micromonosporaceae bacterium]
MASPSTTLSIPRLRSDLNGRVIAPGDAEYDAARAVFPGGIDRHPAVIVRVADASDVSRVVALARETGLELAVRSGGHSGAGHGVCDDGILLDLSGLRALDLDAERRTAWAQTGLTAAEYAAAAGALGLATGFGDTGSVGIGGITLGGGIGYLARKYGLTIDALLAAEVVTADGELLRVDEHNHPDLFWAIRGGGGNFGVATRFQFRLEPLPAVVGGMLLLPATSDVIAGFIAEAEAAPDELSTIANVMPAPPMPFVPEEHRGQLSIMALMCYAGPTEEGQRVLAPFRALATPIVDMVRPIPYAEMYPPEDESYHPVSVNRTFFVDSVDGTTADTILDHIGASSAMMSVAQLRVLGGAVARVPNDSTAYAHRGRRVMANVAALYQNPDDRAMHEAWANDFAAALRTRDGAYVNFLADEGADRVREAYPGTTWDRLAAVKARYDPTNLFRRNQNIPPAP